VVALVPFLIHDVPDMKRAIAVIALALTVSAQNGPIRVAADEAESHVIKNVEPVYPPSAEMGRIQGNVVLQVVIDERGNVSDVSLVRGHPLLADAAKQAVRRYRYRPFEPNGAPEAVQTLVMVTFGNPAHNAEDRLELKLDDQLAMALNAASKGAYSEAEAHIASARNTLAASGGESENGRWRLNTTVAQIRERQQKFDEAEQSYMDAYAVYKTSAYPSPNAADSLFDLSKLYVKQKKYSEARDSLKRSMSIYETSCKKVQCTDELRKKNQAKSVYGYWELSKLAVQLNDNSEASSSCKKVLDNKKALNQSDRDPIVTSCQDTLKNSAGK
jgi:TonB family protein